MAEEPRDHSVTRRDFIRTGTSLAAIATASPWLLAAEQAAENAPLRPSKPLPMRPLGKTGVKVTIINQGTSLNVTNRLLDHTYARGVRYFDTADCYSRGKSERGIAKWFQRTGKRKEIFLVTKDHPRRAPGQGDVKLLLEQIDKRLEALQTDYIDLFFIHGINPGRRGYGPQSLEWPKSKEFKEVCEKLKKSGKVKFVGFSCHDKKAHVYLSAAAEGGFLDAIMVAYNPVNGKPSAKLDRALDACHKAGIGLIAMKTLRGLKKNQALANVKGLTLRQAILQAVLSDERIASICSEMANIAQIDENTEAARRFKRPMTAAEIEELRRMVLAVGVDYCPGCEACSEGIPGTHAEVHDILRYLSYYEQDGKRDLARELYRSLPAEARDLSGADLEAARNACASRVDFAALLGRAQRKLA